MAPAPNLDSIAVHTGVMFPGGGGCGGGVDGDGIKLLQELGDGGYALGVEFVYSTRVDRHADAAGFRMDAKGGFEEMVSVL